MSRHTPTYRARRQRMRRQRKYRACWRRLEEFAKRQRDRFAVEDATRVALDVHTHADRRLFDALQATPCVRRGTFVIHLDGDVS